MLPKCVNGLNTYQWNCSICVFKPSLRVGLDLGPIARIAPYAFCITKDNNLTADERIKGFEWQLGKF